MKTGFLSIFASLTILLGLAGCTEIPPDVNPIVEPDGRNVLIEPP